MHVQKSKRSINKLGQGAKICAKINPGYDMHIAENVTFKMYFTTDYKIHALKSNQVE